MISPSSIQTVTERADIIEVIEQFIRLKKRGANYIANCPFHNEKTPSFSVSASKGIFKCFGCGKGGNVVNFVQEYEKISYPEAIRWLAQFYKIEIEETQASQEQAQVFKAEEFLRVLNEFAANYFQKNLLESEEGQAIGKAYFKERGFRDETLTQFKLGYCSDKGPSFYETALANGFDAELLLKSGIVKQHNGTYYDSYRGRVIFPIQNLTGKVLGFGARILKTNDKAPKYINTPENELYIKSKILYGMYQARHAIHKQDECYLVEGYTDVISLHQAGIANVVASSGTSLTEDQLRLIGRTTKNLTILYDGDPAGIKAAMRGLDMALEQSFRVHLALLPEGHDPDSFVQELGAQAFEDYIKTHKKDVIGFRMEVGIAEAANDPTKKSKLVNEIAETISKINKAEDFTLQDYYIKQAVQYLQVDEAGMIQLVNKYIREHLEQDKRNRAVKDIESIPQEPEAQAQVPVHNLDTNPNYDNQEWQLIKLLLNYGAMPIEAYDNVAQKVHDRVDIALIENHEAKRFFELYFNYLETYDNFPPSTYFVHYPDPIIQAMTANLLADKNAISPNWEKIYGIVSINGEENYKYDVESSLSYFELKKVRLYIEDLQKQLHDKHIDAVQIQVIFQQIMELKKTEKEILMHPGTVIFKSKQ